MPSMTSRCFRSSVTNSSNLSASIVANFAFPILLPSSLTNFLVFFRVASDCLHLSPSRSP
ncbi:hypothetical protein M434DRAFT_99700 [Hypoxylon sp. CO27-5]|nr:hypothetical protein M434DRAFT_99700 [Hypoxylon sp. CO27-5]